MTPLRRSVLWMFLVFPVALAAAAAPAGGLLVAPGAEPPAASALVYWTAPAPGNPLPAPDAHRPRAVPIGISPVDGPESAALSLQGYSAVRVPAGTWSMSLHCVARRSQSVGQATFRFEAGRSYLLQCGGSQRRIGDPIATDVGAAEPAR